MSQLRNKPFLVIDVLKSPARGVKTEKKGWINNADNWHVEMIPHMEKRISDKAKIRASIIIDVLDRKLVRNAWAGSTEDVNIVDYYLQEYSGLVQSFIQQHPELVPVQNQISLSL